MTQQYAVLDPRPFGRYQRGTVLELEAMRGEPLSKSGAVLKISPKEAAIAERVPGALPVFADAELQKIIASREAARQADRKVTKTSLLKR